MASILWACWDGGGNLNPSLGVAHECVRRGHDVAFVGRPEMVPRVRDAGLSATAFAHAATDRERYAFHPMPSVFGFVSSPAVGEELVDVVDRARPDLVVIDAMFGAALDVAPRFAAPTAVMVHTLCDRLIDGWRANLGMQSDSRVRAGFAPLPSLDVLWGERDAVHVNTLASLDGPSVTSWGTVRHGGPVLTCERRAANRPELPWPDPDPLPLVLLSFSTVPEQRDPAALQRALTALAGLPVHAVATTGGIVDPSELDVPANAHVVPFADHDTLMARSALVVGHGGHGTTMRALSHGVPLVVVPARGADQVPIAQAVTDWQVGVGLPADASVEELRDAASAVLGDPACTARARLIADDLAAVDGARLAADTLDVVLAA